MSTMELARIVLISVALAAPSEVLAQTSSDKPGPHEGWKDAPALSVPRRTSPAATVVRGSFTSAQVNVDEFGDNIVGDAANEPSIAVDATNPNRIAIGWRQFDSIDSDFRQAGYAYSRNAGLSWTFPGVLDPGIFRSDPVLQADAEWSFYFYSLQEDWTCQLFISADGGTTWTDPIPGFGGDKAWTAIDRGDGIGHGNFYAAWDHAGCCGDNWFTRSTDGGATFDEPVPIPEQPIWGQTAVGPDGEVYITGRRYATSEEFVVVRSTTVQDPTAPLAFDLAVEIDLGGVHQYYLQTGPNPGGLHGNVCIDVDRSDGPTRGNVYVLASVDPPGPDPMDVMFIRSTDGGNTWSPPVRVNDDEPAVNSWQWFGTMAVAPNGRIDAIWADTRSSGAENVSEIFYAYSLDAGVSWSENEVATPAFDSWLGWPQQDKLGDYYDMDSDVVGANLAYAATFNGEQDVYFMRIGDFDCNGNGVGDAQDIADGTSADINGNGIPDECECLGDLNGDGRIDLGDLAILLANYGTTSGATYADGDLNGDGAVDLADLAALLAVYGTDCE